MSIDYFIGVDNGFGMTKTRHETFVTSIKKYGKIRPSLQEDVIVYKGDYYGIGGERKRVHQEDKTADDETYILTLAALAKEIRHRGEKKEVNIVLAVGLPIENCGRDANDFSNYFKKEDTVEYEFEGELYKVTIEKVVVCPQGYSAVALELGNLPNETVLMDVGSWTIDILPIENKKPIMTQCMSLKEGAITCMNAVNEALRREIGKEVKESQIQAIMMGNKNVLSEKYTSIIERTIRSYVEKIVSILEEHKFNIETLSFVICGGGSCIFKNFGMDFFETVRIMPEINANAVGYEEIAEASYKAGA